MLSESVSVECPVYISSKEELCRLYSIELPYREEIYESYFSLRLLSKKFLLFQHMRLISSAGSIRYLLWLLLKCLVGTTCWHCSLLDRHPYRICTRNYRRESVSLIH